MPGTFVPVENVAEVRMLQQLHGQTVINIHHLKKASALGTQDLANIVQSIRDFYSGSLYDYLSQNLALVGIQIRDLTTQNGIFYEESESGLNGSVIGDAMPGNVALAVKSVTGLTGRSFRGRTYIAGFTDAQVNGNEVYEGTRTSIVNVFNAWKTSITGDGYAPVVVSKYSGYTVDLVKVRKIPTPRAAGIATPIAIYTANSQLDSQRRRLQGRGI